jgi:hypothetical protein
MRYHTTAFALVATSLLAACGGGRQRAKAARIQRDGALTFVTDTALTATGDGFQNFHLAHPAAAAAPAAAPPAPTPPSSSTY